MNLLRFSPHRLGVIAIAVTCAWFALTALVRPRRTAAFCGVAVPTLIVMAFRDLGSAISLLVARDARPGLMSRVVFDAGDTALLLPKRPHVAAMAAVFGLASGALLLHAPVEDPTAPSGDNAA